MELTIRIGELENEKKEIATEVKRLELEISHLSSQRRIESVALETLGMCYPRRGEVSSIRMKNEK